MALIEVSHLQKSYGAIRAVKDVSFSVERGEVVGFLGPNGAGKSTTMKLLTGYLRPDAGSAVVAGFVAVLVGYTSSVAIVFQAAQALGATPAQTASWMWALGLAMGLSCIGLSLHYRLPVLTAWCTPGAALLAATQAPELDAAVVWYGCPPLDYIDASKIKIPLQGHWATQDQFFKIEVVDGLEEKLKAAGVQQDMSFITTQIGMFSYSGLTKDQMVRLRSEFGVYGTDTGRMCVAALNSKNIAYVCDSIAKVM